MIITIDTTLDLGDLGVRLALVTGEVTARGPFNFVPDETYFDTKITLITVALNSERTLDATGLLGNNATATLEEELEAEYLKLTEGK